MAEATLSDVVGRLRTDNRNLLDEQKNTTNSVQSLVSTMERILEAQEAEALQRKENRREGKGAAGSLTQNSVLANVQGGGPGKLLGALAGAAKVALAGLSAMFGLSALSATFAAIGKTVAKLVKGAGRLFLPLTAAISVVQAFLDVWDKEEQNYGEVAVVAFEKLALNLTQLPLKLIKWVAGKILGFFGFNQAAEAVMNWDSDQWLINTVALFTREEDGETLDIGKFITRMLFLPVDIGKWVAKKLLGLFGIKAESLEGFTGDKILEEIIKPAIANAGKVGPAVTTFFTETLPNAYKNLKAWIFTRGGEGDVEEGYNQILGLKIPTWTTIKASISETAGDIKTSVTNWIQKQYDAISAWVFSRGGENGVSEGYLRVFGTLIPTWTTIKESFAALGNTGLTVVNDVSTWISNQWSSLKAWIFSFNEDGSISIFGIRIPTFSEIIGGLTDTVFNIAEDVQNWAAGIKQSIFGGVPTPEDIQDLAPQITGSLESEVADILGARNALSAAQARFEANPDNNYARSGVTLAEQALEREQRDLAAAQAQAAAFLASAAQSGATQQQISNYQQQFETIVLPATEATDTADRGW